MLLGLIEPLISKIGLVIDRLFKIQYIISFKGLKEPLKGPLRVRYCLFIKCGCQNKPNVIKSHEIC